MTSNHIHVKLASCSIFSQCHIVLHPADKCIDTKNKFSGNVFITSRVEDGLSNLNQVVPEMPLANQTSFVVARSSAIYDLRTKLWPRCSRFAMIRTRNAFHKTLKSPQMPASMIKLCIYDSLLRTGL